MDGFHMDVDLSKENELPFGYRFHPTPVELLQYYLVPKMRGQGLPSEYVKDLDVYKLDPEQIPVNQFKYARDHDEAYFFVPVTKEILQDKENLTRSTPNGYWKILEHNVPLYGLDGANIGCTNKLEFYHGKNPNGNCNRTDWKMVEYRTIYRVDGNVESFMVCKLRQKTKDDDVEHGEAENNVA